MSEIYTSLIGDLVRFGSNFVYALIVLIVGFKLAKYLSRRIAKSRLVKRLDANVASYISTSSKLVLRVMAIIIAALVLGIPASAMIAVLGSAGVAIGLALQGSLSNFAGGLMILFFHPFGVGDYIQTAEHQGTVKQISAFYTTIITVDNKRIVLPNGSLTNNTIINFSAETTRMLALDFSVAYNSDPAHVRRVLLAEAAANPMVLTDPAPSAPMIRQGDSALVFGLRVWVNRENCKPAEFALLESVKLAFDREGISIPYPQMDIHVKQ